MSFVFEKKIVKKFTISSVRYPFATVESVLRIRREKKCLFCDKPYKDCKWLGVVMTNKGSRPCCDDCAVNFKNKLQLIFHFYFKTMNYFECKVSYVKIDGHTGKEKKTNESYIVDAASVTDGEARITEEMESMISGSFIVKSVKEVSFSEIIIGECGYQYKAKVSFISIDEELGRERRINSIMLVNSDDIESVIGVVKDVMKDSVSDYEILSIVRSNIEDVFLSKETGI